MAKKFGLQSNTDRCLINTLQRMLKKETALLEDLRAFETGLQEEKEQLHLDIIYKKHLNEASEESCMQSMYHYNEKARRIHSEDKVSLVMRRRGIAMRRREIAKTKKRC